MHMDKLEQLDKDILKVIEHNARLSYSDIGEMVGVSRVAVKNHIERLQNEGVIKEFKTVIAKPELTESIMFILDVTTTIDSYESILEQFKNLNMLTQVYSTTGECRIHAVGKASDSLKMQNFVNNLYRNTEGMRRLECHTVLSTIKDLDGGILNGTERNSEIIK